jgi:hypothetical protein
MLAMPEAGTLGHPIQQPEYPAICSGAIHLWMEKRVEEGFRPSGPQDLNSDGLSGSQDGVDQHLG